MDLTVALDAMGGDHAPEIVLQGADIARLRFPDVRFLLYGDEAVINPLLDRMEKLRDIVTVHHTDQVVTNEAKPSVALRQGKTPACSLRPTRCVRARPKAWYRRAIPVP